MKTRKNTPKYGLIYNASIVGQAGAKLKGKISRTLANKCSICARYDALGEENEGTLGVKSKSYIEGRLKLLETGGQVVKGATSGGPKKWNANGQSTNFNETNDFY